MEHSRGKWRTVSLALFLGILLLLLVASPGIGTHEVGVGVVDAWRSLLADHPDPALHGIAWQLRFPRSLKALVAGATLALSGAVFQTLCRNQLATPYTLGVASGASLGALLAFKLHWVTSYFGLSSVSLASFMGALLVLALILILARSSARITGNSLLLAGVTIGFFCSGMMMFVTSLADVTETHLTVRWLMGSLDTFGGVEIKTLLPFVVPAWAIQLLMARSLNQFSVGSELAMSRGVNVLRTEILGILASSLAVAAVVSLCGPIGFVGLIIPHLCRLLEHSATPMDVPGPTLRTLEQPRPLRVLDNRQNHVNTSRRIVTFSGTTNNIEGPAELVGGTSNKLMLFARAWSSHEQCIGGSVKVK